MNFQTEVANRKDLRNMRIFTIDPATAKDLDDAIHVIPGACFDDQIGFNLFGQKFGKKNMCLICLGKTSLDFFHLLEP